MMQAHSHILNMDTLRRFYKMLLWALSGHSPVVWWALWLARDPSSVAWPWGGGAREVGCGGATPSQATPRGASERTTVYTRGDGWGETPPLPLGPFITIRLLPLTVRVHLTRCVACKFNGARQM